ncbi:MAG: ABC transporter substrate-binding protein [Burkholderiales bacterium]
MKRRAALRALILSLTPAFAIRAVLRTPSAFAQRPATIPRIGVLILFSNTTLEEGLRQGLREHGYVEGKSIIIEWRRSAGTDEELRSLAADLAGSKVDLIVAPGSPAARAAMEKTAIPVVFMSGDPVAAGFAVSLARPGGNGTGVSVVTPEMTQKRMEFLKEVVPNARRVAYLRNPTNPLSGPLLNEAKTAAHTLGVALEVFDARNVGELDASLDAMRRSKADGFLVAQDLFLLANKSKICRAMRKTKRPAVFPVREYHDEGVLMSYGANLKEAMRRAAAYVDKILKGAKPSELPIEQLSSYEFVVNLRVAREMGIDVPQSILLRADEVIK